MRRLLLTIGTLALLGCVSTRPTASDLATAESFIDAFYSFDSNRLLREMESAPGSEPYISYYQGWAEGANYRVLTRHQCRIAGTEVNCSVTVDDDLLNALGIDFNATDTFHLKFKHGRIVEVKTSSDDPPRVEKAFAWVKGERFDVVAEPCRDYFAGGPTPQDCARAVVKQFGEFAKQFPE